MQGLEADERRRPRIAEYERELAFLLHRVDGNHDPADLPGREHRDGKLGHVLEVDGEPVTALEPEIAKAPASASLRSDLGKRERPVEVVDQRPVGSTGEHARNSSSALATRVDVGGDATIVERQPRRLE